MLKVTTIGTLVTGNKCNRSHHWNIGNNGNKYSHSNHRKIGNYGSRLNVTIVTIGALVTMVISITVVII